MIQPRLFFPMLSVCFFLLSFFISPGHAAADNGAAAELQGKAHSTGSVHATLSGLSDEQVRQLLISELLKDVPAENEPSAKEPAMKGPAAPLARILESLSKDSLQSEHQLRRLLAQAPSLPANLHKVFISLCPLGTASGALQNFLSVLFFISIGFVIELLVKRRVLTKYFQVDAKNLPEMRWTDRFNASMCNALPDIIGLCLFFGASFAAFFLFNQTNSPVAKLPFLAIVIAIALIRTASILLRIFLSPEVSAFRIVPLDCRTAAHIYRIMVIILSYIITALMFTVVVFKLGAERHAVLLLQLFFATLLLANTAIAVLVYKTRVRDHIGAGAEQDQQTSGWGRRRLASVWHILALLYLGLLWFLLISSIAGPDKTSGGAFLLSFFALPIWMIFDKLSQWVVLYAMGTLKIHRLDYGDGEDAGEEIVRVREKGRAFYHKVRFLARTAVALALLIWLAGLWNIEIPFVSMLAAGLMDSLIIMTVALVFWRFIDALIERKMRETLPEVQDEGEHKEDSEWGAAATRGRSYTLLPMVRKFVASVLVVMVTLTILSSIGVDIGPLLAGAGVVGLALGFGAQKLVSDMFSGFFYLLDDAFRVGEYVTAGPVSGMVESITLRNVMLRHHRGMLQIVPHSELGAITNFMRGGMVVKFNLDFPYDADIDKIRKIIKKVGIAMLEDEEYSKGFIHPIKSQGVREIANSVMTIRVKFTAKPGTHFIIRREAYKRITEALAAAGIHYAHKRVIVDVPGLSDQVSSGKLSPEQARAISSAAGAAALASINAEEEKLKMLAKQKS
jgi:moderate conductance mechanosensitive channel